MNCGCGSQLVSACVSVWQSKTGPVWFRTQLSQHIPTLWAWPSDQISPVFLGTLDELTDGLKDRFNPCKFMHTTCPCFTVSYILLFYFYSILFFSNSSFFFVAFGAWRRMRTCCRLKALNCDLVIWVLYGQELSALRVGDAAMPSCQVHFGSTLHFCQMIKFCSSKIV